MLQLLSWLWYQAGKVFEWFGGPFWTLYQRLTNFFSILSAQIQQALHPVYGTIWQGLGDLWNRSVGFVNSVGGSVSRYATDLFGITRNEINLLDVRVQNNLKNGMNIVQAIVYAIRDTLTALINSWIGRTQVFFMEFLHTWADYQSFLGRWVQAMINTATLPITAWLTQQVAGIKAFVDRVEIFIATTRAVLAYMQGRALTVINAFVSDPVGFVIMALVNRLLDIIFQLLAEELGALSDTIPERPDWGLSTFDTSQNGSYSSDGSLISSPGYVAGAGLPGSPSGVAGAGGFSRPLSTIRVSGYRFSGSHPGVDLGLSMGTPVYAAHDGVVQTAQIGYTGYGINVTISGGRYWTRYAHLQQFVVSPGQQVQAGQLIGYGDSTGNSTGPHLHFEVKVNGQFIDPLTIL